MITAFEIENFKGIRERVKIDLRPLTLLFGANSAGKSSILHALEYAAEVLERRNLNAGLIGDGAAGVDLGGFQNFVHGHSASREVTLGFTLGMGVVGTFFSFSKRTIRDVDEPSTLFNIPKTFGVELTIGWSNLAGSPFVRRYAVTAGEEKLAEIVFEPGTPDCELSLNERHPIFIKAPEHSSLRLWHPLEPDQIQELGERSVLDHLMGWAHETHAITGMGPGDAPYTTQLGLLGQKDALPDFDRPLSFDADWNWVDQDPQLQTARLPELADYLTDAISQVVLGPGWLLRKQLSESRFLGPIREVPQRNHTPSPQQERARWSSGLGAWDRLETAEPAFIDAVSQWLGDEDRLNSGYKLQLKKFKELDLSDPLVVQLLTGRAFEETEPGTRLRLNELPTMCRLLIVPTDESVELRPSDVGIGISQVVPVIVSALDAKGRIVAIEQPELHLHPAMQVRLGDLFIEQVHADATARFLIETHSEHLLLRLLRRIRETSDGDLPAGHPGLSPEQLSVIYVEMCSETGQTAAVRVEALRVDETGEFRDQWPHGFFEERAKELF